MQTSSPDVLVVGAGPVGLTTAAELARHGVRCRIIDHLVTPLPYCRAIGVTPRTLEVWDDMPHVWHVFAKILPEGQQAIDKIGKFVIARTS